MSTRITRNKLEELAKAMGEHVYLSQYEDGTFSIRVLMVQTDDNPDKELEPATIFNKNRIKLDEVPEAIENRIMFNAGLNGMFYATMEYDDYTIKSLDVTIAKYYEDTKTWVLNQTYKDTDAYRDLTKTGKTTYTKHYNIVKEHVGPDAIFVMGYDVSDFGL